jgi:hypothetical protein
MLVTEWDQCAAVERQVMSLDFLSLCLLISITVCEPSVCKRVLEKWSLAPFFF